MLSSSWVKGKSPQEAKRLSETVSHSQYLLGEITKILKDRIEELENKEATLDQYESASWSHRQAHLNGMKHALKETIDLLTPRKRK